MACYLHGRMHEHDGAATDVWTVPMELPDDELKPCPSEWMFEYWGSPGGI